MKKLVINHEMGYPISRQTHMIPICFLLSKLWGVQVWPKAETEQPKGFKCGTFGASSIEVRSCRADRWADRWADPWLVGSTSGHWRLRGGFGDLGLGEHEETHLEPRSQHGVKNIREWAIDKYRQIFNRSVACFCWFFLSCWFYNHQFLYVPFRTQQSYLGWIESSHFQRPLRCEGSWPHCQCHRWLWRCFKWHQWLCQAKVRGALVTNFPGFLHIGFLHPNMGCRTV